MNPAEAEKRPEHQVGRYAIYDQIAAGGMASVHLARLAGPEGFSRVVAVKRLHRHLFQDAEFKRMFLDEARLAARVRHLNVVPILDVLVDQHDLMIVMEYVHGESLLSLSKACRSRGEHVPPTIASALMFSVLHGLHAAHEARDEQGQPLSIVHRDVSPHNVMVGVDGVARVLDFGVAKARQARQDTNPGTLKGKYSYMAPEVLRGEQITRQADVFSAAVVFWEVLAGRKLFPGRSEQERLVTILKGGYPRPRDLVPAIPVEVDEIVMRGLEVDPRARYESALEMASELEAKTVLATQRVIAEWVHTFAAEAIERRAELLQQIEVSKFTARSASAPEISVAGSAEAPTSRTPDLSVEVNQITAPAPPTARRLWWLGGAAATVILATGLIVLALGRARSHPSGRDSVPLAVASQPAAQPIGIAPRVQPATAVTGPAPNPPAPSTSALSAPSAAPEPARASPPPKITRRGSGRGKDFLPEEL